MIFANKEAFTALGTEPITPSHSHASADCTICTQSLALHPTDQSPKSRLRGYHDALRIHSCGHAHGVDCLSAWLDVSNTCPTCNRMLFELNAEPIIQEDIDRIVYVLGPMYGEGRVHVAIAGLAQKMEVEVKVKRKEQEMVQRMKVEREKEVEEDGFMWEDSDEEFEFEEEDREEVEDGEAEEEEEDGDEEKVDGEEE